MMSGMQYTNPYSNPWLPPTDYSQYGVGMPAPQTSGGSNVLSTLGNIVPFVGPALGLIGNIIAQNGENHTQERFYNQYMSPQARMAQMKAAGINPNAAAQGIAGSAAPQMNAASPTDAFTGIGDLLGNSVNTALSAGNISSATEVNRTQAEKNEAETNLTDSMNTKQQMENARFAEMQQLTIDKMKQDNRISTSTANMLSQDEYYHGVEASEHCYQTIMASQQMAQEFKIMEQEFLNKCAEYQLIMMNIGKTQAEISEVWSRIGLNKAQIEHLRHVDINLDANTALTYDQSNGQKWENEILSIKAEYEKRAWKVFEDTGFDMKSPTNQNYLRLIVEGKTDEAKKLMESVYDYSKGQYGNRQDQTRKWINTGVGALATVAGAVMLFVPGLQGAGVATGAAGIAVMKGSSGGSKTYNNGVGRYDYDGNWNSLE